jgi:hypothetical protein
MSDLLGISNQNNQLTPFDNAYIASDIMSDYTTSQNQPIIYISDNQPKLAGILKNTAINDKSTRWLKWLLLVLIVLLLLVVIYWFYNRNSAPVIPPARDAIEINMWDR